MAPTSAGYPLRRYYARLFYVTFALSFIILGVMLLEFSVILNKQSETSTRVAILDPASASFTDRQREVHNYSFYDGRPIQLDLWSAGSTSKPRPAIVFFHAGKLVGGNRRSLVSPFYQHLAASQNWSFISADYRLLVPASGHHMINDVEALFAYITSHLPQVDHQRIAVVGTSAGGYIARLAGLYASPKPCAVVSMQGRGGDLLSTPYMRSPNLPLPEPLASLVAPFLHPTPEQAAKLRHEWDIPLPLPPQPASGPASPDVVTPTNVNEETDPRLARKTLALWQGMMDEGTTLDHLTATPGLNAKLRASFHSSSHPSRAGSLLNNNSREVVDTTLIPPSARAVFPQLQLSSSPFPSKSSSRLFPPMHLSHGTSDTSVFPHESQHTHAQLLALGIHSELILLEGRNHMFELGYREGDKQWEDVKRVFDSVEVFLRRYLDSGSQLFK